MQLDTATHHPRPKPDEKRRRTPTVSVDESGHKKTGPEAGLSDLKWPLVLTPWASAAAAAVVAPAAATGASAAERVTLGDVLATGAGFVLKDDAVR